MFRQPRSQDLYPDFVKSILKQPCRIYLYVSVKFKESTQWYKIFYVATAIATAVYSKNMHMTKNTD